MHLKKITAVFLCIITLAGLTACGKRPVIEPADGWYTVWAAAPESAELSEIPRNPLLSGNTCRQQVRASLGGDKIRLTFSNEYGSGNLVIESVHIAHLVSAGSPAIDTATDTAVTFSGSSGTTVKGGSSVTSDEISFAFEAMDMLSVTVKFGDVPNVPSCHKNASCTTWVVSGDRVSDQTFTTMGLMSSYYFLSRIDTYALAGTETLVCFGDSVTGGAGSSYNGFDSYPEALAKILNSDPKTENISVVGASVSELGLFSEGSSSAKRRFENDVLNMPGVHSVMLLIGGDDIKSAQYDISSEMADAYKDLTEACHRRGITVYAGTIPPFEGNTLYYSELHEKIRKSVNEFIMSADSGFDGFVDFATILCRAENDSKLQSDYDSGDSLHPNAAGYEAMAKAAAEMLNEKMSEDEE